MNSVKMKFFLKSRGINARIESYLQKYYPKIKTIWSHLTRQSHWSLRQIEMYLKVVNNIERMLTECLTLIEWCKSGDQNYNEMTEENLASVKTVQPVAPIDDGKTDEKGFLINLFDSSSNVDFSGEVIAA